MNKITLYVAKYKQEAKKPIKREVLKCSDLRERARSTQMLRLQKIAQVLQQETMQQEAAQQEIVRDLLQSLLHPKRAEQEVALEKTL